MVPASRSVGHAVALGLSGGLSGCAAEERLAPGVLVEPAHRDAPPDEAGRAVVAYAAAQVGRPYCWGGTGPHCFDCSGLATMAWRRVGVRLPRTADALAAALPEVPPDEVRAGDILWWPGHVALYAGNGWAIEALNAKSGVVMRRASTPERALRPVPLNGLSVAAHVR